MSTFPSTVVAVVTPGLSLYKVVGHAELPTIVAAGHLYLRGEGPEQWNIGLRENLTDAIERENIVGEPVSKDTHVVLEITFTTLGVAQYTKLCQGPDYHFQPTLQKISYRGTTDWKVWHFHGDLPLQAFDAQDNLLITTRIMEII